MCRQTLSPSWNSPPLKSPAATYVDSSPAVEAESMKTSRQRLVPPASPSAPRTTCSDQPFVVVPWSMLVQNVATDSSVVEAYVCSRKAGR